MANLLLTTRCNRACPYCFARGEMAGSEGERMSWENLVFLADFLVKSGEKRVSLLGGEPTLHPEFVDYLRYLLERGFDVNVFSNGILSEEKLADLRKVVEGPSPKRLHFVCNLNDPEQTPAPEAETRRIEAFLEAMGPWVGASFNIYRTDFRLEFLCDLILRHGMRRQVRLGMTHPVPGQGNRFILPEEMGGVVERLYSYRPLLDRLRIKPGLDCGFPLCKFTDEQLGWMRRLSGHEKFECGPAIDITPDMTVYSCFPMASFHRRSIFEFDSIQQVGEHFKKIQEVLRVELPGLYPECDECVLRKEGACSGGGACQILNRMSGEARVRIPEIEDALGKDRLPR